MYRKNNFELDDAVRSTGAGRYGQPRIGKAY